MRRKHPIMVRLIAAAAVALVAAGQLVAQRLPPPDSSRPPRLTRLPPDSIRYHVRHLRLAELLSSLQRGDSAEINSAVFGVHWSGDDAARRALPQCRSLGRAASELTARVNRIAAREQDARTLPVFISDASFADSGGVAMARGTIVIVVPGVVRRRTHIVLAFDDDPEARIVGAAGLLKAVCDAAGVSP